MSYHNSVNQLRGGPRPSRPVHQASNGFRTLHETSQGRIFDLPPEDWIPGELRRYGARRATGKVKAPSLQGPLHPVFARACWRTIGDKRYDALLPSMYLASRLIALSGAAYASFLPDFKRNTKRKYRSSAIPPDDLSPHQITKKAIKDAMAMFDHIAPRYVNWCEDNEMFRSNGWWAINMPGNADPPFDMATTDDWEGSDELDGLVAGDKRRINIGIASEFADTILKHETNSEPYLFASFYCAVTMVHELGHWLSTHVVRANDTPADGEPFLGDAVEMEAGNSYIGWLFGGFRPDFIIPKGFAVNDLANFEQGLCWLPILECRDTKPRYITRYSMSIDYIERLMSEETWTTFLPLMKTNPGLVRRYMLFPSKFRVFETARTAKMDQRLFASETEHLAKVGDKTYIALKDTPFNYVDLYWSERIKKSATQFNLDTYDLDRSLREVRNFVTDIEELKEKRIELEQQKVFEQNQQARLHSAGRHQQLQPQYQFKTGIGDQISRNQDQQSRVYQNLTHEIQHLGSFMGRTDVPGSISSTSRSGDIQSRNKSEQSSVSKANSVGDPMFLSSSDEKKPINLVSSSSSSIGVGMQASKPIKISSSSSRGSARNATTQDILPPAPLLASLPEGFQAVIAHIKDMRRHPERYPDLRPDVDLLDGEEGYHEEGLSAAAGTGRARNGATTGFNRITGMFSQPHRGLTAAFEDEEDEEDEFFGLFSHIRNTNRNPSESQDCKMHGGYENGSDYDDGYDDKEVIKGKGKARAANTTSSKKSPSPKSKTRLATTASAAASASVKSELSPSSITGNVNVNNIKASPRTSPAPSAKRARRGATTDTPVPNPAPNTAPLATIEPPIKFEGGSRGGGVGVNKRQKTTAGTYIHPAPPLYNIGDEDEDDDVVVIDNGGQGDVKVEASPRGASQMANGGGARGGKRTRKA